MLCLMRRSGESIKIGDDITIIVNRIDENQVSLGITAPRNMAILRDDCKDKRAPCSQCGGAGGFPESAPHMQKCLHCGGSGVR